MPVYSRQTLRRHLGQFKLRDTYVGTTTYYREPRLARAGMAALEAWRGRS